jgi:hypothetical protein
MPPRRPGGAAEFVRWVAPAVEGARPHEGQTKEQAKTGAQAFQVRVGLVALLLALLQPALCAVLRCVVLCCARRFELATL